MAYIAYLPPIFPPADIREVSQNELLREWAGVDESHVAPLEPVGHHQHGREHLHATELRVNTLSPTTSIRIPVDLAPIEPGFMSDVSWGAIAPRSVLLPPAADNARHARRAVDEGARIVLRWGSLPRR